MKFKAIDQTADGRITKGEVYEGQFTTVRTLHSYNSLRIVVRDNKNEWMTFDPKIFIPDGYKQPINKQAELELDEKAHLVCEYIERSTGCLPYAAFSAVKEMIR